LDEPERIQGVYQDYDRSARVRAQRDPANRANRRDVVSRDRRLLELIDEAGLKLLSGLRLLEIGCGFGHQLGRLCQAGANPALAHGVDLLEDRIAGARAAYPEIAFAVADARHLPFPDQAFDVVLCMVVFSSILDSSVARDVAQEVRRVLAPRGAVAWYDNRYPNPANRNVRSYSRRNIEDLFPGFELRLEPITPVPPLMRRLGPLTDPVYTVAEKVPALCVRYLGLLRPPDARRRPPP
jgi:SAM-dependent methyltransferase